MARLAEQAWDFIAQRPPGAPKIRCETVPLLASPGRKAITVLEIVNDDMPFLVDSVMGELADRRLEVRLVVHPVFGVQRDNGKLKSFGAPDAAGNARESFIYIHMDAIDDAAVCGSIAARVAEHSRRGAAGGAGLAADARPRQRHRR